jgi:hypothetical protein
MLFGDHLPVRFGAGDAGFVAPDAMAIMEFQHGDIRAVGMSLTGAMAGFAGELLVGPLEQQRPDLVVAFAAGLSTGEHRLPRRQLAQGSAPVESIFTKARWRQQVPGDGATGDYAVGEQQNPQDLRGHDKETTHSVLSYGDSVSG